MLPREQRLRSNQEFQRVYRGGRSWAHPLAALHVRESGAGKRLGVSVSKKVGKAVERNRVRRRLREILRAQVPGWKVGFDAVIVARAAAAGAEFSDLTAAVHELARRARLLREPDTAPDTLYLMPASAQNTRSRDPRGPGRSSRGT
jgi:ribonuclease P protein component